MLLGRGRHQVEHLADVLHGRGDHVQLRQVLPGLGELEIQPDPLAHRVLGDAVGLVGRGDLGEVGEHLPRGVGVRLVPGGGEVVEFLLGAREPDLGGQHRAESGQGRHVLIGEHVGGSRSAGRRCRTHPPTLTGE